MKSKKIVIVILILLILLLIAGGVFVYTYIATDIFKTDQEMFFKYLTQLTEKDGFIEKEISEFKEKKKQIPYENSGIITADVEYPDDDYKEIIEKVNELAIRFSGKIDSMKQKVEQNIEVDYGDNVILPINYMQDGEALGLQTDELSKKYIAVKNENIKQLLTNLGVEDVSELPNKIDISDISKSVAFTEEEIETLKQIYGNVLKQNLLQESFSSIKTEQSASYTLELNNEQIKNITIKMLEETKENTLIIDKINEFIIEQDPNAEKIDASIIDDLINEINGENKSNGITDIIEASEDFIEGINGNDVTDIAEIPNLKITLTQMNKELKEIKIQVGSVMISVEKIEGTDSVSYNIECIVTEEYNESVSILEEQESNPMEYNLYFNTNYNGLEELNAVEENYEFGFYTSSEDEKMKYAYKVNTNTIFSSKVSIGNLDKNTAVFLNDYDKEKVINFLAQVGTKMLEINKKQMTELGLKEYENPILYSNPITMLGLYVYKTATNTIMAQSSLTELEKQQFNEQFSAYEGEIVSGSEVNAMIKIVQNSNIAIQETNGKNVKVTLNGNDVIENVDSSKIYKVEAVYDVDGYIAEMRVSM